MKKEKEILITANMIIANELEMDLKKSLKDMKSMNKNELINMFMKLKNLRLKKESNRLTDLLLIQKR